MMRLRETERQARSANAALDFFVAPVSLWALAAVAAAYLVEDGPIPGTRLMIGIVLFAMVSLGFEVGIKRYYARGRPKYFYLIFLPPTILTIGLFIASFPLAR